MQSSLNHPNFVRLQTFPISVPEGETKSEIMNVEKEIEDTEEVADIGRLDQELNKCSTLTEKLKIIGILLMRLEFLSINL